MSDLQKKKIQISDVWGIEFVKEFEAGFRVLGSDWSVEDVIEYLDFHKSFPSDFVGFLASDSDLQKLRDAHYIS